MPAADLNPTQGSLISPIEHGAAVTPHDTNELTYVTRAIYVGVAGDLSVVLAGGSTVTLTNVPAGALLPLRARRVRDTATDADEIVALW